MSPYFSAMQNGWRCWRSATASCRSRTANHLYVSSAREKLDKAAIAREPHAGGLFRLHPKIPGQPKHWRVEPRTGA